MRVLITGGAGFIGSHTAEAALSAGYKVRIVDNLLNGSTANLPEDVEFIEMDVTNEQGIEHAIQGCQSIIHLAAMVSVPASLVEPMYTYHINTTGTVILLEAARRVGIQRFVFASTCAVYGDLLGTKDESSPVRPLVPYATSKLMAEQWTQLYAKAYTMQKVTLRYFNVYGPRQRTDSQYSGVIARWCAAVQRGEPCIVFGDGSQTRDFISVRDVARANLFAATSDNLTWGDVYNVSTKQSYSLNRVLDVFDTLLSTPVQRCYLPFRKGDILHSSGNSDKLQRLGWHPKISLVEGLTELLNIRL